MLRSQEFIDMAAKFYVQILIPYHNANKDSVGVPLDTVQYLIEEVVQKRITFSQAKMRYKDCCELMDFIRLELKNV